MSSTSTPSAWAVNRKLQHYMLIFTNNIGHQLQTLQQQDNKARLEDRQMDLAAKLEVVHEKYRAFCSGFGETSGPVIPAGVGPKLLCSAGDSLRRAAAEAWEIVDDEDLRSLPQLVEAGPRYLEEVNRLTQVVCQEFSKLDLAGIEAKYQADVKVIQEELDLVEELLKTALPDPNVKRDINALTIKLRDTVFFTNDDLVDEFLVFLKKEDPELHQECLDCYQYYQDNQADEEYLCCHKCKKRLSINRLLMVDRMGHVRENAKWNCESVTM